MMNSNVRKVHLVKRFKHRQLSWIALVFIHRMRERRLTNQAQGRRAEKRRQRNRFKAMKTKPAVKTVTAAPKPRTASGRRSLQRMDGRSGDTLGAQITKARDRWRRSESGRACHCPGLLRASADEKYLRNRLECAFLAGVDAVLNREVDPASIDPKLSDGGVRRGTCMVGGKVAVEAGAVTHGAVRCSAWLGDVGFIEVCCARSERQRPRTCKCRLLRLSTCR